MFALVPPWLTAIKLPLILVAVTAASGLGLYLTHSLKQAGAAAVETQMLREVIEHNEQTAASRETSLKGLHERSRQANAEIAARDAELAILRTEVPEEGLGQCPKDCYL